MSACKVGQLDLDTADAELLARWMTTGLDSQGRRVSGDTMAAALAADGHDVGPTTVKAHKAGRCACRR